MYLGFSAIWVLAGMGILIWHAVDPAETRAKIGGISMGWFALLLGLYNLARWWSYRSQLANRRAEQETREQRRRPPREEPAPDPNSPFDFGGP